MSREVWQCSECYEYSKKELMRECRTCRDALIEYLRSSGITRDDISRVGKYIVFFEHMNKIINEQHTEDWLCDSSIGI